MREVHNDVELSVSREHSRRIWIIHLRPIMAFGRPISVRLLHPQTHHRWGWRPSKGERVRGKAIEQRFLPVLIVSLRAPTVLFLAISTGKTLAAPSPITQQLSRMWHQEVILEL